MNINTIINMTSSFSIPFRVKLMPRLLGVGKQAALAGLTGLASLASLAVSAGFVFANPAGQQVVQGQATFNQQGNILTITNSPNAIINWQNFSINPGETTRFVQQNSDSSVLNRIVGQNPSQIFGALQSNGRIFLINPNGILFGRGSQVDVHGLVASSLNLSNQDFLAGKQQFVGNERNGNVRNEGNITTPIGGQVFLLAPNVENSGLITSPKGEVLLAAGHSVKLVDATNPDVQVVVSAPASLALNLGQVVAQGGRIGIYGALVKQSGRLNADSAVVGENGKIVLRANRDTLLDAGSQTSAVGAGQGGEVQILGGRVALLGNASVDASGQTGGGTILLGGDFQGKNSQIKNAERTILDRTASLKADALNRGDGGKVIVWANDETRAYGLITARGGEQGGNGGFVETSGKHVLDFHARVNVAGAKGGRNGTLLLDPARITLVGGTGDGGTDGSATFQGGASSAGTILFNDPDITTAGITNIFQSELEGLSNGTNIVLQATDYVSTTGTFGNLITLPNNSNLLINTRNAAGDGTGLRGIDLTTSMDGANLEIRAQGTGTIDIITGTGVMPQRADIMIPKLSSSGGAINVRGTGNIAVAGGIVNPSMINLEGANIQLASNSALNAGPGMLLLKANDPAGGISFGAGASVTVTGTGIGPGIGLVADNMILAGGSINAGTGREVRISTNNTPDLAVVAASTGGNRLTLTPADLNAISASDLTLNSNGVTGIETATAVTGAKRIALFGNNVFIQSSLSVTPTDGNILLAGNSLTLGANGSLSRTGTNGRIFLLADNITFGGAAGSVNGGAGEVAIAPKTSTVDIELGVGAVSRMGVLGLTAADLSTISTSNMLEIGNGNLSRTGNNTVISGGLNTSVSGGGLLNLAGGAGTGNLVIDGPLQVAGNLRLASDAMLKVTSNGSITANNMAIEANQLQLQSAPASINTGSGTILIRPRSASYNIDLGSMVDTTANTLEISDTELKTFAGSGVLRIGDLHNTFDIQVSSPVAPTFAGVFSLDAGGHIGQVGTISANALSLDALMGINLGLTGNSINKIAARVGDMNNLGNNFKFANSKALIVASNLDGISGIGVAGGMGGFDPQNPDSVIALRAGGPVTQETGALLGSKALFVQGTSVNLSEPNPVGVIAGVASGTGTTDKFVYASANGINVSTVDGMSGIMHNGAPVPDAIQLAALTNGITQDPTAPLLTAGGVVLGTTGGVNLMAPGNQVGALTADGVAALGFKNGGALTLNAVVSTNQPILVDAAGTLTIADTVDAGSGMVKLSGQNVDIKNNASINGSFIDIAATQPGTGLIGISAATNQPAPLVPIVPIVPIVPNIGSSTSSRVRLMADNFNFNGIAPNIAASTTGGVIGIGNFTDNAALTIDSRLNANYVADFVAFGNPDPTSPNTTSAISIATPLSLTSGSLGFGTTGNLTQSAPVSSQGLAVIAGNVALTNVGNQVQTLAVRTSGGNLSLTNARPVSIENIVKGNMTIDGIQTNNGAVGINNTGAVIINRPVNSGSGAISVVAHSPLTVNAAVTSTTGNITLEAGSSNSTGDVLTVSSTGSVVSGSGNIQLRAGSGINLLGSVTSQSGTLTQQPNLNTPPPPPPPPPPTIDQCIVDPTISGCAGVLPALTACIATPTLPGCSVVLPTIIACVATPALPGCSVVLPTLMTCIANPVQPGCSVVLPTLMACIATPNLPGCAVVLPNVTACMATPALPGCAVVLPTLMACIATPTLSGCSVVLPNVAACIATPALPGCAAVLPTLMACIATPALPGCAVVLPNLMACIVTPALLGCNVILPTLMACIATPGLSGCTAVLPTLAACIAAPGLPGCNVILPVLTACITMPNLPGCSVVLPSTAQCSSNPGLPGCPVVVPPTQQTNMTPISQALNETVKIINTVVPKTESLQVINVIKTTAPALAPPPPPSQSESAPPLELALSRPADAKQVELKPEVKSDAKPEVKPDAKPNDEKSGEKKDEKKEDKKDDKTALAKDDSKKKDEPVRKLYCN